MNKKEIITLIIVGVLVAAGAGVGGFFLARSIASSSSSSDDTTKTTNPTEDDTLTVNGYTLKYGQYASAERDENGNRQVQTVVFLNKDNFIAQGQTVKYSVENDRIKLESGLTYQVIGDNKLLLPDSLLPSSAPSSSASASAPSLVASLPVVAKRSTKMATLSAVAVMANRLSSSRPAKLKTSNTKSSITALFPCKFQKAGKSKLTKTSSFTPSTLMIQTIPIAKSSPC